MKRQLTRLGILHKLNVIQTSLILAMCSWVGLVITISQLLFVEDLYQLVGLFMVILLFIVICLIFVYHVYKIQKELEIAVLTDGGKR